METLVLILGYLVGAFFACYIIPRFLSIDEDAMLFGSFLWPITLPLAITIVPVACVAVFFAKAGSTHRKRAKDKRRLAQ